MKQYIFKFDRKSYKLKITFGRYPKGNHLYMGLEEIKNGELFADITVYISPLGFRTLEEDEIIVKTYDYLENLDLWLIHNKIAVHTGTYLRQNYIEVPVMKLTPEFMEENKAAIASAGEE